MPLLAARKLGKTFRVGEEEVRALSDVDLEIAGGEFVAVTGASGSGKSTLLSLLAGLERPSEGEVLLDGKSLSVLPDAQLSRLRRRELGFVFQSFNLVPVLTLLENVGLPFMLEGQPRRAWEAPARAALEQLGLGHRHAHLPDRVSMGERQRAAIARALVVRPKVIFADEPTGSLDSRNGAAVLELLRQARAQSGCTVVLVTHDAQAAATADRAVLMRDGRIEGAGA
ncbi:MAG TPA: ABC transporter ATP-binding protein [Myxococcales bacterium]|nr:ABC transporter ATP-binding protein [Myxococcales bacterium]